VNAEEVLRGLLLYYVEKWMIRPLELLNNAREVKAAGLPGFDATLVSWADDDTIDLALESVRSASHVSFDLETTGLNEFAPGARVALLSLTVPRRGEMNAHTWLIPLSHKKGPWFGEWREILRRFAIAMQETEAPLIAHNGPFDVRWIAAHTGIDLSPFLAWDTMVAEHLLDENSSTKLKECVPRRFNVKRWDDFDLSSPGAAERAPLIQLGLYAARDTYWTWILYLAQQRDLWLADGLDPDEDPDASQGIRLGNLTVECVMPMLRNLTNVQVQGLRLDQEWVHDRLESLSQEEEQEFSDLVARYEVENSIGDPSFAPTSKWFRAWTAQAVEKGDLRVDALTRKGIPQWNKTVLKRQEREGREIASKLLVLRQASKQQEFLRSWMDLVSPESRIHAKYNVGRVSTGRLSSSEPNLQQVTKALKPAFIPTPGYYIAEIDYSQIELRAAAFIARCTPMIEAYQHGDDLHRLMAAEVTGKSPEEVTALERQQAKAANFGFLYGQEAFGFVNYAESSYGVLLTLEQAVAMRNAFFERWEGMEQWHMAVSRRVRRNGFVTSPVGRVRRLEDALGGDEYLVAQAERQAINSPVQSFASDIMQLTAADIGGQFGNPVPRVRIVGTVHDSLVVEVPIDDWQRCIGRAMQRMINPHKLLERLGCRLDVPLAVEASVGSRWGLADVATVVS
jgi:DNA polymerase-1